MHWQTMCVWLNKYCPRWICKPQKSHPFGNFFHTICYGNLKHGTPIIYWVKLVEENDWPQQLGCKEFEDQGKMVGLTMQMSKNLWNKGKVVTMDSVFLVSKWILPMWDKGVFIEISAILRGTGWPVLIPGKYQQTFQQQATWTLQNSWACLESGRWHQIFNSMPKGSKLCDKNYVMPWHSYPSWQSQRFLECNKFWWFKVKDSIQISKTYFMPQPSQALGRQLKQLQAWSNCFLRCVEDKGLNGGQRDTFLLDVAEENVTNSRVPARKKKAEPWLEFGVHWPIECFWTT